MVLSGLLGFADSQLMLAVLLGGLCAIVPQMYMSFYAFRSMGASQAALAARQMYRGQVGKFTFTLVMLAIVFVKFPEINIAGLFLGYIAMWLLHLVCTLRLLANHRY